MSKYTTEVRFICEQIAGEGKSVDLTIALARQGIFNFDYPIFNEAYRPTLETKILKHFYFREIGEETTGLWKVRLNMKLNEIMPYYNKLYQTELLEYNPLYTTNLKKTRKTEGRASENITETGKENGRGTSKSKAQSASESSARETNSSDSKQLFSDTPQGSLTRIEENTYLTNATVNQDSDSKHSSDSSTSSRDNETGTEFETEKENGKEKYSNETEDFIESIAGYEGTNVNKSIKEFRQNLLNIDMQIINELNTLFINLW